MESILGVKSNVKELYLKNLIFAVICTLVMGGLYACNKQTGQTFRSGGYVLEANLNPDPPVVGENRIEMRLLDSAGRPVTDATIRVRAFMPAMGAMPAMEAKGKGEDLGEGRYAASFSLSMSGNWDFTIKAEKPENALATFNLQIAPPRPGLIDPSGGSGSGATSGGHQHGSAPMGSSSGAAQLSVAEPRQQLIGVRTALVETRELSRPIRTVGRVEVDETRLWHVTLKYSGWIEKLFVDFTGAFVEKGQPLFTLYSQELYVSQQEYLDALRAYREGQASKALLDAARERLALWDLTTTQIRELERRGTADKYLTIYSPAKGYVVNKMAVEGHEVRPGMRLYEIADLSKVWVIADVYEYEATLVKVGNAASITDAYTQGPPRAGVVDYVYPHVDTRSRTLPVRVVFENPNLALKPGMYVNVRIDSPLGPRIAVPERLRWRNSPTPASTASATPIVTRFFGTTEIPSTSIGGCPAKSG